MAEVNGHKKTFRVLVIGAGSSGLLTAHALQLQGAHVSVYEQAASVDARPRDWDFGIYWAQDPLAECLPAHLAAQVEDCQVNDHRAGADETMPIYNGGTEELMKALPIPYNIRLGRRRFQRLISRELDIHYNKRIAKVESDGHRATAHFEDGTSATGDLLIGAEGAHSIVREFLVGPEKAVNRPLPIVASFAIAKLPPDAVRMYQSIVGDGRMMVIFHPEGTFAWIGIHEARDGKKPGEWEFLMAHSWMSPVDSYDPKSLPDSAAILADVKRRLKNYGPRISAIWDAIPEGTRCWHSRLSQWIPQAWDNYNGTLTLVGDASHSMTFHRGQGLNNAIHDVALLARKTKEHGFTPAAVSAYETEMIPRAADAVTSSHANSMMVHDWSKLLSSPLFSVGLKQT